MHWSQVLSDQHLTNDNVIMLAPLNSCNYFYAKRNICEAALFGHVSYILIDQLGGTVQTMTALMQGELAFVAR